MPPVALAVPTPLLCITPKGAQYGMRPWPSVSLQHPQKVRAYPAGLQVSPVLAISLSLLLLVSSLPMILSIGSISGYTYIAELIGVIIFLAIAEMIKLNQ